MVRNGQTKVPKRLMNVPAKSTQNDRGRARRSLIMDWGWAGVFISRGGRKKQRTLPPLGGQGWISRSGVGELSRSSKNNPARGDDCAWRRGGKCRRRISPCAQRPSASRHRLGAEAG